MVDFERLLVALRADEIMFSTIQQIDACKSTFTVGEGLAIVEHFVYLFDAAGETLPWVPIGEFAPISLYSEQLRAVVEAVCSTANICDFDKYVLPIW
jgi:hypothetical protein